VIAKGITDQPDDGGVSNPTLAALFCVPPVAHAAINTGLGLPGLGRLELPLTVRQLP
jgi:hypothetical protein